MFFPLWLILALFAVTYFVLSRHIKDVAKLTEQKAMWLAVDAMANCRKEFNEYADACDGLNEYRKKYGVDGVPEMLEGLYNRRREAKKQLQDLIVD